MNKIFVLLSVFITSSCGTNTPVKSPPQTPTQTQQAMTKPVVKEDPKIEVQDKIGPEKPPESYAMPLPYSAVGPVAYIGTGVISAEEFNDEVKKQGPLLSTRNSTRRATTKAEIIDKLIRKRIIEIDVEPFLKNVSAKALEVEFTRFTDQMAKNPGGVEQFYKRAGLTEMDIKADMKKGLALKALLSTEYDLIITKREIKTYYKKNKRRFKKKAEVKASHILFKTKAGENERLLEAKRKAMELYEIAKKPGVDFGALAKEHSEGPSAQRGGDLGYFTKERMVSEFSKAAFATKKGRVTKPVKTAYGYHLIKVVDKRKARLIPLSEVSENISRQLEMKKMEAVMKIYLAKRRKGFSVELILDNVVDNPDYKW